MLPDVINLLPHRQANLFFYINGNDGSSGRHESSSLGGMGLVLLTRVESYIFESSENITMAGSALPSVAGVTDRPFLARICRFYSEIYSAETSRYQLIADVHIEPNCKKR